MSLFDTGLARNTDPYTSKAAARQPRRPLTGGILEALAHGPKTADEIVDWLVLNCGYRGPEGSVESAVSRLCRDGRVCETDEVRPSRFGSPSRVRALP